MNDKPYAPEDNVDIDTEVYALSDGSWLAQVKCLSNPSLSTPTRKFKDQSSADHWVRKNIDIINRATINENQLRRYINTYLQIYL